MNAEWQAEGFQIVWFTPEPSQATAAEIFAAITGKPPLQTNTAQMPQGGTLSTAIGPLNDVDLRVQHQAARVDIFVAPGQTARTPFLLPSLIDVPGRLKAGLAQVQKVGPQIGPAVRLAIVANLFRQTDSIAAANETLLNQIGVTATSAPSEIADLTFSMNVKKTTPSGIILNRLLRWGTEMFINMSVVNGVQQQLANIYTTSVLLDVNTVPGAAVFSIEECGTIFDEIAVELCGLMNDPAPSSLSK